MQEQSDGFRMHARDQTRCALIGNFLLMGVFRLKSLERRVDKLNISIRWGLPVKPIRDELAVRICMLPPVARLALIIALGLLGYGVLAHFAG
jgi:hypothetical protein